MKKRIINARQEYATAELVEQGLAPLFKQFEREFREYTAARLGPGSKHNAPNFNLYKGYLERACHAAQTLAGNYDLGIGIAKKGMWLSYIFSLYGLQASDFLVSRTGDIERVGIPLAGLRSTDVPGKRVLIFDNDLVTGNTVRALSDKFRGAGASKTDLLLIYGNTRLKPEYFEEARPFMNGEIKIVGRTTEGEIVVNTENQISESIGESWSLEKDFNPGRKHLAKLAEILGVSL